jgi:hypothetical protein
MRAAFIFGFILSLAAVAAAAAYVPWISHPRLPSRTQVVPNGGRAERFVIRLPADQIAATGSGAIGVRGVVSAGDLGLAAASWVSEQFKLRDVDGSVIGLAARHWTQSPDGPAVAWLLVIPSRGALVMAGRGEALGGLEAALRRSGYVPGTAWSGRVDVPVASDAESGAVLSGSEEFAELTGRYEERWVLSGVGVDGALRGTIELDTQTFRAP